VTISPLALALSWHLEYGDCSAVCPGSERGNVPDLFKGGGNFPGGLSGRISVWKCLGELSDVGSVRLHDYNTLPG